MSTPFSGGLPPYKDFDCTFAAPVSPPKLSQPIPGDSGYYRLEQEWQIHLASFAPLALNTPHPQFTNYYLTKEGNLTDMGGGMVKWTREYCQIPTSPFYDPETTNFQYPGVIDIGTSGGLLNNTNNTSRGPYSVTTLSRVRHDYYLVDSSGTYPGGYADASSIPSIRQTIFCSAGTLPASGAKVGAVYAISPYVVPVNGAAINGAVYLESVPNTANYMRMVSDAGTNGWNATQTVENITYDTATNANYIPLSGASAPTWGGILWAEDSRVSRWRGSIYVRTVRQVLAR